MTQRKEWDEMVRSFAEYDMYISVDMSKLSKFMVMVCHKCSTMRTMDSVAFMCI